MADAGRARRGSREAHQRVTRPYVLRGRLYCGYCGRRMQGQYSNHAPYYRCRYPKEYALASHVRHPGNVYLREADVLPAIDRWLRSSSPRTGSSRPSARCKPPRTHAPPCSSPPGQDTEALIADCDARLARYQAALDAGADPQAVAGWTRQVKAERAAALARDASQDRHQPPASSPRTTSVPSSPASATCATSSATPSPPPRQPSTNSSGSRSPTCPDKTKSGPT